MHFNPRGYRIWADAHLARGEQDDRERARDLLEQALSLYVEMEIPKFISLVEGQLLALG